MFFSFVWLFRRFHQAFILWNSFEYFQQIFNFFEKYPKCFWTLPHEKILFDFSPNHKILSFGKNFFPTLKEKSFCQRKKAFAKQKDFSFRVGKKLLLKQKDFSLRLGHFLPFFLMKLLWKTKIFVRLMKVEKARTNEKNIFFSRNMFCGKPFLSQNSRFENSRQANPS